MFDAALMSLTGRIDREAVAGRLEVIADALGLAGADWRAVAFDDGELIAFAGANGQSLDWIVFGEVRGLIRAARAGRVSACR